ncbi:YoaK family protein [Naasia sp. SYSU D00057]|uniref:YoaK family protein n=1 Tax=Naasia sp. SYSU D00057 TaxID=2817380 RepID=UPI0027DABEB1|nr:YoaK family protein [Naasia sp. SYSU D00057]
MRARLRQDQDRLHLVLMLVLTFSTGIVDAVGYLGLDRVFTANMTGNVVILGMALTGADDLPVVGPVVALVGFVLGAMLAGLLLRGAPKGWHRRVTALLGLVGVLLVGALLPVVVGGEEAPEWALLITTGVLGLAMGLQAGAARHIATADVTTVVITSTLAGLAFDSWLGRRVGQKWVRRLLAVVLIALGALAGAALLQVHLAVGIAVAAVITLVVAAFGQVGAPARERAEALEGAR